ncbi:MAG: lytic transglycosylase domain-containing protein [Bradyrhizobium sp.]|nr:lytic transglycosylase domain-containing protein [Bradyrhizobium sp.]
MLLVGVNVAHAEPIGAKLPGVVVTADRITGFVTEAAQRFAIPSSWIRAVMRVESLGDVRALSPKGAMGLMQIMPETWTMLRLRYGLGADPYDPRDNIAAGAAYLRELHDRYGAPGFLAAYNSGPGRYENHLATGRPLPSETLSYMAAVASLIGVCTDDGTNVATAMAPTWSDAPLFVPQSETSSALSPSTSSPQMQQRPADGMTRSRTALAPLSDGLFAKMSSRKGQP